MHDGAFLSWSEVSEVPSGGGPRDLEGLRLGDLLASGRGGNVVVVDAFSVHTKTHT